MRVHVRCGNHLKCLQKLAEHKNGLVPPSFSYLVYKLQEPPKTPQNSMNCPLRAITPRSGLRAGENYCRQEVIFSFFGERGERGEMCAAHICEIRSTRLSSTCDKALYKGSYSSRKAGLIQLEVLPSFYLAKLNFAKVVGKYCKYPRGTRPSTTPSKSIKSDRTSSGLPQLFLQYCPVQLFIQLLSHFQYRLSAQFRLAEWRLSHT